MAQGPRSVGELARAAEQSNANASQHLQALHAAGLVTRRRDGLRTLYALAGDDVLALNLALRDVSAAESRQAVSAAMTSPPATIERRLLTLRSVGDWQHRRERVSITVTLHDYAKRGQRLTMDPW